MLIKILKTIGLLSLMVAATIVWALTIINITGLRDGADNSVIMLLGFVFLIAVFISGLKDVWRKQ